MRKTPVMLMSAAFDEGVEQFKQAIREAVAKASGETVPARRPKRKSR